MRHGRINSWIKLILPAIGLLLLSSIFTQFTDSKKEGPHSIRLLSVHDPVNSVEMKKARWEYFFRLQRDPITNEIPPNIRERELAYARTLPKASRLLSIGESASLFDWNEVGPVDIGGRTRALALDVRNPNIILAGGVSGGIWKSSDGGATWELKNDPSQVLSITSLAQDTRSGYSDTWYYAAGEYRGNTASDRGYRAYFYGAGLYKSEDNGETWQLLHTANKPSRWDSPFDYVSRILVSPISGSVFIASNGGRIYRSTDAGNSFNEILGGINDHYYTDIVVTSNGTLIAVLSEYGYDESTTYEPGIYVSTDDGLTWTKTTPSTFPSSHKRTVLACAPSNPEVAYALTFTGEEVETLSSENATSAREDVRFHKINIFTLESEDRSANLPDFGGMHGFIDTQNNYNMVVAVKPDDENFVLIGATCLFRSKDGFATAPEDILETWIGGYEPTYPDKNHQYPNLHPDQHAIAFDPTNPNKVWCGHDGGLSFTPDITASPPSSSCFPWQDMNIRYVTTQFYTVTIPDEADDERIMGGTQDNGTPSFKWEISSTTLAPGESAQGIASYTVTGDDLPGPLENTITVTGTDCWGQTATRSAITSVTLGSSSTLISEKALDWSQATIEDTIAGSLENMANTPEDGTMGKAASLSSFASVASTSSSSLALEKSANMYMAAVGDSIAYTFTVKNTGEFTISNISLTDSKLGTITLDKTTLASGESAQGTSSYTVVSDDLPGPLENTATVSGTDSQGKTVTRSTIASVTLTATSILTLEKTANVSTANVGDTVNYTFTVNNAGNTTISSISLTDSKLGTITLGMTDLAPGESTQGTASYTVAEGDSPGPLENTATVSGTDSQGKTVTRSAFVSITLSSSSTLTLEKISNVSTAIVGDVIRYSYTAKNTGETTISDITLKDDKVSYYSYSMDKQTLAPNESAKLRLWYTVVEGDMPGPLENTATVSGKDSNNNEVTRKAFASVTLTSKASLMLNVTPDLSTANVGDTITYSYIVTNTGDTPISGLNLTDSKLGAITLNKTTTSTNISSGDGAYAYYGDNYAYVSYQNGEIFRVNYDSSGYPMSPYRGAQWSRITPEEATDQLFINPFVVDPSNEEAMIYAAGRVLWRNDQLSSIPDYENQTSAGWTKLEELAIPEGYSITTLAISRNNPMHVLYYGASSSNEPPKIFRLENADTATSGTVEVSSLGEGLEGAYVHSIAINPDDANEIIVILSNYNIVGLYHSIDGGQTYTAIEGNLEGDENNPGPSLRSATILPTSQGTLYIVGTSTGVYLTTQLNGSNTIWVQEGPNKIGNVVVEHVTSRKSDGRTVVGTHGRGIFVGNLISN